MGEPNRVCDVLILGGGPAGCAAAIQCAQVGLRVVVAEAKAFPRHRPGETLHPGVEPVLRQLGAMEAVEAAGFPRHEGNWVQWGTPPRFEAFGRGDEGPWRGFQAWRATFDALLLERARASGAGILQPCRAIAPIRDGDRVKGLRTTSGTIEARWVIDAAGGAHWLARHLGIPVEKRSGRLIAHWGYRRGSCAERDEAPLISADPTGWTWIARVQPELYQWTRLNLPGKPLDRDWMPGPLAGLEAQGPNRASDVTWRKAKRVAGPGFFLAGDAAASLDPTASHGVLKALMSGMMAGHLIQQVRSGKCREKAAMLSYEQWLSAWFESDLKKLTELYGSLDGGRGGKT